MSARLAWTKRRLAPVLKGLVVLSAFAAESKAKENATYSILPGQVVRGKDYNVVVRPRGDCQEPNGPLKGVLVDLDGVSGIAATDLGGAATCFLRFKLSVAADAQMGDLNVPLVKDPDAGQRCPDGKSTSKCTVDVLTLNVAAIEKGATPPGLADQTDILWKVLPQKATSDSFGRAFTKRYFAIEVVIGNNAGYDLQIASIGFKPPSDKLDAPLPSDAYNVGRSTLVREQEVGRRALIVNSVKTIGTLMAAGSAFFFYTGAKARWDGATAMFAGPFEKGLELVWADKTIRHLQSLDNRALRDSVIIPNNTSQRILVFMSREIVECRSGEKKEGCADNPQANERLNYRLQFNPETVMRRMGELVIVGRTITYLNRVRVVSTPVPGVIPPPVAQPSSELGIVQGVQHKAIALIGTGMRGAAVAFEAGVTKLKISEITPNADGTQVNFKVSADWDCPVKTFKLFVATPSGKQDFDFAVTAAAPRPDESTDDTPNPSPPAMKQGESKQIAVKGAFLKDAKVEALGDDAKKPTPGRPSGSGDAVDGTGQTLTFRLASTTDTPPKTYQLRLARGGKSVDAGFEIKGLQPVVDSPKEEVKGKNPAANKPFEFSIKGSNLATAQVKAPDGAAISVTVVSPKADSLSCRVDTSKAKAGDSFELSVVNGDTVASQKIKFTVAN